MTAPAYIRLRDALAITGHETTDGLAQWIDARNAKHEALGLADRIILRPWGRVHAEALRREWTAYAEECTPAVRRAESAATIIRRRRAA